MANSSHQRLKIHFLKRLQILIRRHQNYCIMSNQSIENNKKTAIAKFQKVALDVKKQKATKGGGDWIIIEEVIMG